MIALCAHRRRLRESFAPPPFVSPAKRSDRRSGRAEPGSLPLSIDGKGPGSARALAARGCEGVSFRVLPSCAAGSLVVSPTCAPALKRVRTPPLRLPGQAIRPQVGARRAGVLTLINRRERPRVCSHARSPGTRNEGMERTATDMSRPACGSADAPASALLHTG
jgi:hypothetical protein